MKWWFKNTLMAYLNFPDGLLFSFLDGRELDYSFSKK